MGTFSQANRVISITTPLGTDALLLESFSGYEAISAPFRFRVQMLSESTTPIAFDSLLGQSVTISLTLPDGSPRPINGILVALGEGTQVTATMGTATFIRYRAEIVPQFWLLTRNFQSRTFQQMTVPAILAQVLNGLSISDQTTGQYQPRDYCVQYRESDFDFASRLMEEEGIFYSFKHATGSHQMVLSDSSVNYPNVLGATTAIYETILGNVRAEDRVSEWLKTQELRSGKYTLWDTCFELPGQNLQASQPIVSSVQAGTITHNLQVGGNSSYEIYEYPGGYAQRFDGVTPGGSSQSGNLSDISTDNARTVGIRMQQETVTGLVIEGKSNCRQFSAGCQFTLDRHFDANGSYLLTRVEHHATLGGAYLQGSGDFEYSNTFRCIPVALPFRPLRTTPRPRIEGPQTAVVVGPSGQEIFTDQYGRVKVQFPWDRLGTNDANSSCWIRVASSWAGKQWGFIQIPRIGQEVVVAFEDGDPDRPLIIGSVYNASMMPPYTLPDNATQSGTLTRSSAQGTADNFNQLLFEDKKGSELITFHAEKDFARVVENNDSLTVGVDGASSLADGSQTVTIYNNRTVTISNGNDALTVKQGNQTDTIYKNRSVTIQTGDDSLTIQQGSQTDTVFKDRSVTIQTGNDSLTISTGNHSVTLDAGSSSIEAMQGITLKCGPNSIQITPSGITISGLQVQITGQTQAQIQGLMCQISADAMLQMKGAITMIN
jgi:type VI secretion system secreted protein VgrG